LLLPYRMEPSAVSEGQVVLLVPEPELWARCRRLRAMAAALLVLTSVAPDVDGILPL
jgi:hypothetical protein